MQSSNQRRIRGWLFDVYPSNFGEMAVWIISENGQRIRLTDKFQPEVYVSGKQEDLERLINRFFCKQGLLLHGVSFTSMNIPQIPINQKF